MPPRVIARPGAFSSEEIEREINQLADKFNGNAPLTAATVLLARIVAHSNQSVDVGRLFGLLADASGPDTSKALEKTLQKWLDVQDSEVKDRLTYAWTNRFKVKTSVKHTSDMSDEELNNIFALKNDTDSRLYTHDKGHQRANAASLKDLYRKRVLENKNPDVPMYDILRKTVFGENSIAPSRGNDDARALYETIDGSLNKTLEEFGRDYIFADLEKEESDLKKSPFNDTEFNNTFGKSQETYDGETISTDLMELNREIFGEAQKEESTLSKEMRDAIDAAFVKDAERLEDSKKSTDHDEITDEQLDNYVRNLGEFDFNFNFDNVSVQDQEQDQDQDQDQDQIFRDAISSEEIDEILNDTFDDLGNTASNLHNVIKSAIQDTEFDDALTDDQIMEALGNNAQSNSDFTRYLGEFNEKGRSQKDKKKDHQKEDPDDLNGILESIEKDIGAIVEKYDTK